jgi:hypothetical protein
MREEAPIAFRIEEIRKHATVVIKIILFNLLKGGAWN